MTVSFADKFLFVEVPREEYENDDVLDKNIWAAKKIILIAANRLIRGEPFFASLMMSTKHIISLDVPTAGTNGRNIKYNPNFVASLSEEEAKTLIAHELMHDALLHSVRMRGRHHMAWNVATDYAINFELKEAGFNVPQGFLWDPVHGGKSSEEIYDDIEVIEITEEVVGTVGETTGGDKGKSGTGGKQGGEETGDEDIQDERKQEGEDKESRKIKGDSKHRVKMKPNPEQGQYGSTRDEVSPERNGIGILREAPADPGTAEGKALEEETEARVEEAMRSAMACGNMPGNLRRFIHAEKEDARKQKKDWKQILTEFVQESVGMDDYTWSRPNTKYAHLDVILPSMVGKRIYDFVVAVDTSGSIDYGKLQRFGNHLEDLVMSLPDYVEPRVHVIPCDTEVNKDYIKQLGKEDIPFEWNVPGGGGTRFSPVFDYIARNGINPKCLIYFTDLYCHDFPEEPSYPVKWLVFLTKQQWRQLIKPRNPDEGNNDPYSAWRRPYTFPEWVTDSAVLMDED